MHHVILEQLGEFRPLAISAIRFALIIGFGYLLSLLLNRALSAMLTNAVGVKDGKVEPRDLEMEKRANTVVSVLRRPALILLWVVVLLLALREVGAPVEGYLAGAGISAGIIGVAVGFGAQTLVKDMIAGVFMLLENQIRVNDVAVINGTGGLVEEINLRTTVLRSENGAVHIFANGSIQTLSNLTREFAYYVFEIPLRFEEDTDRVVDVLKSISAEVRATPAFGSSMLDEIEVMGVDKFLASGVLLKARIKTLPQRQWLVGREFNRRIRIRFEELRIVQPSQGSVVQLDPGTRRAEIQAVVKELLAESKKG